MQRIHAIEHHSSGTGAGQRRRDFSPDIAGFANAHNDNLAALLEGGDDGLDGGIKRFVQLGADGFQRRQFDGEYFAGFGKMTHAREIARIAVRFQPRTQMPICGESRGVLKIADNFKGK